ncbi:MAG TPA: tetratricopeptide repeat protein [Pyrinomonadaceae bacterium]|nr:tetratricopeptide repeat protein [Pyrinomonadaceae bacterium]
MAREGNESYEFGDFRLDVGEHKLVRLNGPTNGSIPEKAFQTLVHLVRNAGALLTKDELLKTVWRDVVVEENNLVKAIYAIRRFLDDMSESPKYIETIPKHGYRFVAKVARDGGESKADAGGKPTKDFLGRSPAYDLYLRGKVKVGNVKREETEAAIKLLEEAIALDPNFAEALGQLARAYIRMAFNFSEGGDRDRFLENAEVAIEAALDLKPDLAEGHFARGQLLWTHSKGFPHEQAIQSYKRSLESNPNADETYHQLSMVYGHIGLLDEALQVVKKAIEINPNNTMARFRVSNYLAWQGKFEEAMSVLKTVPSDVSPFLVNRFRAEVLTQTGRLDDAEATVDTHLRTHPIDEGGSFGSVRALLLAQRGKKKEATEVIVQCAGIGRGFGHFHHTAYNIASAYAALGQYPDAVKWLEAAADDGFPCYPYFKVDPNLDNLRTQPRFIDLMSGLQKQWKRFKQIA